MNKALQFSRSPLGTAGLCVAKRIALGLMLVLFDAVIHLAQSQIKVDPNSYGYDDVTICLSKGPELFKLSNMGTTDLTITAITLADGDVSQFKIDSGDQNLPITIKVGASPHEVTVSFQPTSPGPKSAMLRISGEDPSSIPLATVDVKLTGIGKSKPVLMIVPNSLIFDYAEITKTVTLTNIGCETLTLTATSSYPSLIKITLPSSSLPHGNNNNQLTAQITVDRTKVCTERPYHETVTINAGAFGDTMISMQVFVYNPPPRLASNHDSLVITFTQPDQEFLQILPSIFFDPSDADLDFDEDVDHANNDAAIDIIRTENKLIVRPKPEKKTGDALVTVTANDGCPDTVASYALIFHVAINQPPQLRHEFLISSVAQNGFPVQVFVVNDQMGTSVWIHYRQGGGDEFTKEQMESRGSGIYEAKIGGEEVTSHGLEYFFTATNNHGDSELPSTGFRIIRVNVGNLSKPLSQPSGSGANDYRLFSMPLQLNEPFVKSVLEDDLGRYNNTQWRVLGLRADQTYAGLKDEELDTLQIHAGRAYWLIVKEKGRTIDTGLGISIPTDTLFQIPLHPRWNFIGNPFSFAIPFAKVVLKSTTSSPTDVRIYNGKEFLQIPVNTPKDSLRPFEGYAVSNNSSSNDTLLVDPILVPRTSPTPIINSLTVEPEKVSSLRIIARCRQAQDSDNEAAFISDALADWDRYDRPEAPVIGDWVSVYFPHPEWQKVFRAYTTDARPVPLEDETWEFEVLTNMTDKVDLTFEGIETVPPQFEVRLWDEALNISRNLRETKTYTIAGRGPEQPKRLKLIVGKSHYVEPLLAETQKIPTTYELTQNFPNPFNPSTTIRYGLPQTGKVTLKVYSLKGEEVAVLANEEQQAAGYHVAIWDGRNKNGEIVGSGVYIYRLSTGTTVITKKMALIK